MPSTSCAASGSLSTQTKRVVGLTRVAIRRSRSWCRVPPPRRRQDQDDRRGRTRGLPEGEHRCARIVPSVQWFFPEPRSRQCGCPSLGVCALIFPVSASSIELGRFRPTDSELLPWQTSRIYKWLPYTRSLSFPPAVADAVPYFVPWKMRRDVGTSSKKAPRILVIRRAPPSHVGRSDRPRNDRDISFVIPVGRRRRKKTSFRVLYTGGPSAVATPAPFTSCCCRRRASPPSSG